MQLVPLGFQVLTEGLLQGWTHSGHRPGGGKRRRRVSSLTLQTAAQPSQHPSGSSSVLKPDSERSEAATPQASFYTPSPSIGACVSPLHEEVSRHDVITFTTTGAHFWWKLVRVCSRPYKVLQISSSGVHLVAFNQFLSWDDVVSTSGSALTDWEMNTHSGCEV